MSCMTERISSPLLFLKVTVFLDHPGECIANVLKIFKEMFLKPEQPIVPISQNQFPVLSIALFTDDQLPESCHLSFGSRF